MKIEAKTLTELAEEYCQKRYDKTLEKLINQLMNQERDVLKSIHHGFGLTISEFILKDNFMSHLLSDYFNLKAVDRGKTFIIGDKIWSDFGFVAAKDKDCFLSNHSICLKLLDKNHKPITHKLSKSYYNKFHYIKMAELGKGNAYVNFWSLGLTPSFDDLKEIADKAMYYTITLEP